MTQLTQDDEWLKIQGWSRNPFSLEVKPSLFCGYREQLSQIVEVLSNRSGHLMVIGEIGSGKTTMLRWINLKLDSSLYLSRPPSSIQTAVNLIAERTMGFWDKALNLLGTPRNPDLYKLPQYLESRRNEPVVLMIDEAHEMENRLVKKLRTLGDSPKIQLILAGLPELEDKVGSNPAFLDRFSDTVRLHSLPFEGAVKLLEKRIEWVGGTGHQPFTENSLKELYRRSGGVPRSLIRLANKTVRKATQEGAKEITPSLIPKVETEVDKLEEKKEPKSKVSELTEMQKEAINLLAEKEELTSKQIADNLDSTPRSVSNLLNKLLEKKLVKRRKDGREYVYTLTSKAHKLLETG